MRFIKLLSALFLFSLTSCTFTENIYINDDGSGKFSFDMDASAIMAMIPNDSLKSDKTSSEKDIDSVFTFKEILESKKDSISKLPKEQQEKLKKMENFSMKMKMNEAKKEFLFSIMTDFKSVSELQDAMSTMEEVQKMNKQPQSGNPMMPKSGGFDNNATLKYTFDGKKFTRKATLKKPLPKVDADSIDTYAMIYESSKYIVKYHFPKKVKSVTNKTALFSEDRKTITIEYPFMDYMKAPEKLNFDVQFE